MFLLIWELVARWAANPLALVPPSLVAQKGVTLVGNGTLWQHIRVSLTEFLAGMGIAALLGVVGGAIIGSSARLRQASEPVLAAIYATPSVALAPLFVIWLGLGPASKIAVIAFVAYFPIVLAVIAGVATVERTYLEVAHVYGAPPLMRFTHVLLPAAMPAVLSGLRLGAGRGVLGVVLGEFFGSSAGLGYLILIATQSFDVATLLLCVSILASFAIAVNGLLANIERRFA
ncbi:MAG: ABC transporter permease [Chloroflexi bacterium]|nr:ABC transporter permease [Chloroflexota bacterium]